jgi:hypothetical protein
MNLHLLFNSKMSLLNGDIMKQQYFQTGHRQENLFAVRVSEICQTLTLSGLLWAEFEIRGVSEVADRRGYVGRELKDPETIKDQCYKTLCHCSCCYCIKRLMEQCALKM